MKLFALIFTATTVLFAQIAFDAASVKINDTGAGETSAHSNAAGLQMTNVTLRFCIERAYRMSEPQVIGPAWLDSDRFDINAKAPASTADSQIPDMLQALLLDRFKLAAHHETRQLTAFALVPAKGSAKLTRDDSATGGGSFSTGPGTASATSVTMGRLTEFLAGPRAGLGLPVVDQTGLTGRYTFTLRWTPEGTSPSQREENGRAVDAPPSIFTALQEQLGLKLEKRKLPVDVLVIDHAERIPTAN